MSDSSAISLILERMPAGLVRRASEHVFDIPVIGTGIPALDGALGGGWVQGRLNVLEPGPSASSGRTTAATASVAALTASGWPAAWVDGDGSLDPLSLVDSGADLSRILWIRGPMSVDRTMKAAHEVIVSGLFAIIIVRPSRDGWTSGSTIQWLRISREAELANSTVLILARGRASAINAAAGALFSPVQPEWHGRRGFGCYLDGASVRIETDRPGAPPAECTFSTTVSYRGFQ